MKTITRLTTMAVIAIALLYSNSVKAQTTKADAWSASIGINPGIPTGNATDISSFVIGGTARLEYNPSASVGVMLTAGYYSFIGKSDPLVSGAKYPSLGMVPVKVGLKYYVAPMFYIDGEAGFGFDTNYENHTKLILSPGIGYAAQSFDIGLNYENYSGQSNSFGQIGLRVAYKFGM